MSVSSIKKAVFKETILLNPEQKVIILNNGLDAVNFGNGEVGGNDSWTAPVYGVDTDCNPVTFSQGIGGREGETLISAGHVSPSAFYDYDEHDAKGHDHYGPNGETGRNGDRGRWP